MTLTLIEQRRLVLLLGGPAAVRPVDVMLACKRDPLVVIDHARRTSRLTRAGRDWACEVRAYRASRDWPA